MAELPFLAGLERSRLTSELLVTTIFLGAYVLSTVYQKSIICQLRRTSAAIAHASNPGNSEFATKNNHGEIHFEGPLSPGL